MLAVAVQCCLVTSHQTPFLALVNHRMFVKHLVTVNGAGRVLYADSPFLNIKHKNVLSEHGSSHHDLVAALLFCSQAVEVWFPSVKVFARKPIKIK